MSDIYRERLCDILWSAEDSYLYSIPAFTADDIGDICKLKLLVHIWMTIDLKAEFVNVKGNTAVYEGGIYSVDGMYRSTTVPENWHLSGVNDLNATYKHAGRTFNFTFAYTRGVYVITVVDDATGYSASTFINEVPGDCEDESSDKDEAIITDIIRQLNRRINLFMEAVQSPDYKPGTSSSDTNQIPKRKKVYSMKAC
ncbi:uncharacterized protein LOC135843850 [Planococcus citri]|uniref:uncharacterized protein LOC135843850 n=1 Tax=Planococcus citri TaxID=170843 RepID=UPI0031F77432